MWQSTNNVVEDYLANESTIRSQALITAEWNLNIVENLQELGNYRYRPDSVEGDYDFNYATLPDTFLSETALTENPSYYGATDSSTAVDFSIDDAGNPVIFAPTRKKIKSLFSLEDCLGRFRPRSGINKVIYFDGKYLNRVHPDMAKQPRFYFPTPSDKFKYWTSYRTEGEVLSISAAITKIYPSELVNGEYVTKLRAIANDFRDGDTITFYAKNGDTVVNISGITGESVLVKSASSNYIKVYANLNPTSSPVSYTNLYASGNTLQTSARGISFASGDSYPINDSVPFVVYKNAVPANRLVVKMQTKVGDINLGPYQNIDGTSFEDPFFDTPQNKAVPLNWKIQTLNENNTWVDAYDFNANPYDIPSHGQVELSYGLVVPSYTQNIPDLKSIFLHVGTLGASAALPLAAPAGYAYLIQDGGAGTFYVAYEDDNGSFVGYDSFDATYAWHLSESEVPTNTTSFISDFTNPESYTDQDGNMCYRDFSNIKGIRIVVNTMTIEGATFDLIEMSPRLTANLTDMVQSVSVTKHASDMGSSGLPVTQILTSTGSLKIFDYDQSFNKYNTQSIVSGLLTKNLQVKIYESIFPGNGTVYNIPIKTLYADGFPQTSYSDRSVEIKLRDLFFYFESMKAPELLIPNCSLSMAVSCLMDSIGFSNYSFKRPSGQTTEPVIPYFFVGPDSTVAQVLQDLAVSTQTTVFLDEYNNLILMSKEYLMPQDEATRATDFTFSANDKNLANILQLSSIDDEVYNDGKISYETKYIQRSYSSLAQAGYLDAEKTWVYKPVLLWEVSPEENTKSWNDESAKQSAYTLAAIPLDTDLSDAIPTVVDGEIVDNTMDLGEAVYWLSRYNGYFYANGEIIKFDAVEYNVPLSDVLSVDGVVQKVFDKKVIIGKDANNKDIYVDSYKPTGIIKINKPELMSKIEVGKEIVSNDGSFKEGTLIKSVDQAKSTISVNVSDIILIDITNKSTNVNFDIRQVTNNVWISSVEEYQKYFTKLPFGGKIYPTGLVRIYAEPYYDSLSTTGLKNGAVAKHGRGQFGTSITSHKAGLDEYWADTANHKIIKMNHSYMFNGGTIPTTYPNQPAGVLASTQNTIEKAAYRGVIRNFLSSKNTKETEANSINTVNPGTVQSSALIVDGPTYPSGYNPLSFVQYVYKPMDPSFKHFETRLRIIGEMEDSRSKVQTPVGSNTYYTADGKNIGGSSGGIGIWVNPKTNCGYYLEIVALTDTTANAYTSTASAINTAFFYKVQAAADGTAIPILLWSGIAPILCDDGKFTGQAMQVNQTQTSVYDLAVDYTKTEDGKNIRFTMYLNDSVLGTVVDKNPLTKYDNVALFVRGSARVMFENLLAIGDSYEDNDGKSTEVNAPVSSAFGFVNKNASNASRKYALSGSISNTILTSTTPGSGSKYNIYFEEFGTIMREAAYFNIKYDKAYPALFAKMSPTFNNNQGYAVSGFTANAFGAEFLIFNITDTVLSLDSGSGNYLRIQGVTFTQNSRHDLTVDEFFNDKGNLSDPQYRDGKAYNQKYAQEYSDIKKNRLTYGNKSFTINAPYLQSQDAANDMMAWLTGKIMKSRKAVGMEILSMPHLQLGDIVKIDYTKDGVNQISGESSGRYVVYSIEYTRAKDGPSMVIYLSEVR